MPKNNFVRVSKKEKARFPIKGEGLAFSSDLPGPIFYLISEPKISLANFLVSTFLMM